MADSKQAIVLEVYPRIENRKVVASHLRRERSRLLATECKILDNHQCQVCEMRFETVFGSLGAEFAESHHIVPLSKQQAFLDFVLAHCVSVGVEELDQEKLTPLLRLKYDSISDAIADLGGKPDEIGRVFAGFGKYLYERQTVA